MSNNLLSATWSQVTSLLEQGFSLIPVRDKEENGKPAKSPYPSWKKYQSEIVTPADLWNLMAEKFNTTAIAVICGKISGNLEVIDIDVKYKPGIDAKIFSDIQMLYPDLYKKVRIHRSPSGGFHILYRIIEQPPPGNQKLAKRATTPADRSTQKTVCFIETRGEGGIILFPPSMGYSIFKADPIPHITLAERNALISICTERNELIKIEQPPKLTKREDNYYDENPFDHFNKSEAGASVLLEFGWKQKSDFSNEYTWFTRPGSKSGERHASFIKSKNLYWFWTTNTDFENEKCYTASAILAQFKFEGDYKATYKELVSRGFGRIRSAVEKKLVRTGQTPPNLSPGSRVESKKLQEVRVSSHPHGIFWELGTDGDTAKINREAIYKVSAGLGFLSFRDEVWRLRGGFLQRSNEREWQDAVKEYIQEPDAVTLDLVINTYEHFLQVAGSFTLTRLPLLDESKLLLDTPTYCYKFFSDCWIKITADNIEKFSYDQLGDKIVFQSKVLDRPFQVQEGGCYIDFLEKAAEFTKMRSHILKIIGYLAHEYKDETTAYIIVLTEQCPDPKMGGGSGKNLFANLFRHITTISNKPGGQIRYDEKFFNSWNDQKLFIISDVQKDFDFLFLKDITSNSAVVKKLFKDEKEVNVGDLPKIIVNTNYSYEISDGGLKRRIIPIEFTDFFTKCGGVKVHYSKFFPTQWNEEDWAGYNWAMIAGIQEWLNSNLVLENTVLTFGGWKKQFEQTYGLATSEFIYENFDNWKALGFISNNAFKTALNDYFEEKNISKMYHPSTHKINRAIEDYCSRMGIEVLTDVLRKENGLNVKGKEFKDNNDTPF